MLKGKIVGLVAVEKEDLPCLKEWRNNSEFRKYFREYRELDGAMHHFVHQIDEVYVQSITM